MIRLATVRSRSKRTLARVVQGKQRMTITHRVTLFANGAIHDCFETDARNAWYVSQSWKRFHTVRNAQAKACHAFDAMLTVTIEIARLATPYVEAPIVSSAATVERLLFA